MRDQFDASVSILIIGEGNVKKKAIIETFTKIFSENYQAYG